MIIKTGVLGLLIAFLFWGAITKDSLVNDQRGPSIIVRLSEPGGKKYVFSTRDHPRPRVYIECKTHKIDAIVKYENVLQSYTISEFPVNVTVEVYDPGGLRRVSFSNQRFSKITVFSDELEEIEFKRGYVEKDYAYRYDGTLEEPFKRKVFHYQLSPKTLDNQFLSFSRVFAWDFQGNETLLEAGAIYPARYSCNGT